MSFQPSLAVRSICMRPSFIDAGLIPLSRGETNNMERAVGINNPPTITTLGVFALP